MSENEMTRADKVVRVLGLPINFIYKMVAPAAYGVAISKVEGGYLWFLLGAGVLHLVNSMMMLWARERFNSRTERQTVLLHGAGAERLQEMLESFRTAEDQGQQRSGLN